MRTMKDGEHCPGLKGHQPFAFAATEIPLLSLWRWRDFQTFQQCPKTVKSMALISLPPLICDLFPLINLWLIVKLLTRDVGIHSLILRRTGEIWDSVLSLLFKMVFQLRRQVEVVTSHWRQCRGGLINFKIMGSATGAILQGARIVQQVKRTKLFAELMKRTRSALRTR